ncbi:MAG: hypothetical protein PVG39_04180 [Desulfobacteraceae bacterium]
MELNSIGSMNSFSGISGPGLRPPGYEDESSQFEAGNIENMDISNSGKIMNAVSRMSEEEKAEIRAFHDEIMSAVKDGTFDASEMAANAPESLTALSEETGIDLEQMIEGMASGPQGKRGTPPPPPPMYMSNGEGLSFNNEEDTSLLSGLLLSDDSDYVEQV